METKLYGVIKRYSGILEIHILGIIKMLILLKYAFLVKVNRDDKIVEIAFPSVIKKMILHLESLT